MPVPGRLARLTGSLVVGLAVLSSAALAAEGDAQAGHAPSSPLAWQADLSLWSAVVFLLFLAVLSKLAWKPLTQGLDARERRIRDGIDAAEQARLKAERMLAEHSAKLDRVQDEVKAILAEARRDADVARQNILSDAQAEAEATKTRAIGEIERVKNQALKELFDHFHAGVAAATEHVLGQGLTVADQDRLIDESLARLADRTPATRA